LRERGIAVGVLSNTLWTRAEHERIFARDGVLDRIDGAVYSSEIPWTKPHPEAFRAALDAVSVPDPANAVFVGDRPFDDIHGAQSIGMRAVLVPHSDIPQYQRGHTEAEADAVIQRLGDLLAVVDAWR
jgi:putative hydrolase of the HAD superfamily